VKSSTLAKAGTKFKRAKKHIADPQAVELIVEGLGFLAATLDQLRVDLEQFKNSQKHVCKRLNGSNIRPPKNYP